jgi:hypothetical protein
VFDIQQGVAILIAVREKSVPSYFSKIYKDRSGIKEMAKVYYYDLWGKRQAKYQFLQEASIDNVLWTELQPTAPNYFFAPKDFDLLAEYNQAWSLIDIFPTNSTGVKTHRDHFVTDFEYQALYQRIQDFINLAIPDEYLSNFYNIKDTRDWKVSDKRKSLAENKKWEDYLTNCLYRPFDVRYYYHHEDIVEYTRNEVMFNVFKVDNICLISARGIEISRDYDQIFCSNQIISNHSLSLKEINYLFPLYIYPNTQKLQTNIFLERIPNFSSDFFDTITAKLGYEPTPEAIFYYAYAIFHSPTYRQRYAEFLKINFPRLPLTSNPDLFKALATEGEKLVNLHLLKSEQLQNLITRYEGQGGNQVTEVRYNESQQRVYINKEQYFVGISNEIWQFKIGGYQVLEKWLKDRKKANRYLSSEDILHYQKIVVALHKTQNIMNNIDDIIPHFPIT